MKLYRFLWIALLWSGGWTSPVRADRADAMHHYEQAMAEYNAGRFEAALMLFERAYEADPTPTLRYNIAQSHWKLGHTEEAMLSYRQYLAMRPNADDRVLVEQRIAELQRKLRPPRLPPADPIPPSEDEAGMPGWHLAAYTVGSIGLASAATGGVFSALTRAAEQNVATAGRYDPDAYKAGKRWERLQYVFLIAGAGAVAAAGVLFLVGAVADTSDTAWVPTVAPGFAGLTARGEF